MGSVPGQDDYGPVTRQPLTKIQQIVGRRLQGAWTQIPHVTHHDEADLTAVERARKEMGGIQASVLAYVARATVMTVKRFPIFGAALDPSGDTLWIKDYINLGIAIESPRGLLVGVLAAVAESSVPQLDVGIADLAGRARAGMLKPSEMEGSCFTISSLGKLGGDGFTPIINPPNVAILGTGRARLEPQWVDGAVVPRLMMPLSLSYDHRVINGADAGRFCALLREILGDPARLRVASGT